MSREKSMSSARTGKALKPPVPPARPASSRPNAQKPDNGKPSSVITLAQLSESDKQKVARLVEKLVALGQEHDNALRTIQAEREQHEEAMHNMASSIEGQFLIIEDQLRIKDEMINSLQTKEAMLTSMLALYQGKMRNMSEMVHIANSSQKQFALRQKDLENSIEHLTAVTETQRRVIEGLEQSLRSLRTTYDQSSKEMLETVAQERRRRTTAEDRLKILEQRTATHTVAPASLHNGQPSTVVYENSIINNSGSSSSSSSSSSSRVSNPPNTMPSPPPSPSHDEYSHYSLMYNSSHEEINTSGLGSRGAGYEMYGTAVATVVDYSPGRPQLPAPQSARSTLHSQSGEAQPSPSLPPPPRPLDLPLGAWTPAPPTDPAPMRRGIAVLSPELAPVPSAARAAQNNGSSTAPMLDEEPAEPSQRSDHQSVAEGPVRKPQERKTVARIPAVLSTPVVHTAEPNHGADLNLGSSRQKREEDKVLKSKGATRHKDAGRDKGKEKTRDKEVSFQHDGKEKKRQPTHQSEGAARQRQDYDASLFDLVQQLNS